MLSILRELPTQTNPNTRYDHCSALYDNGYYIWHGAWKLSQNNRFIVDPSPEHVFRLDLQSLNWSHHTMNLIKNSSHLLKYQNFFTSSSTAVCQHHDMAYCFGGHRLATGSFNYTLFTNMFYSLNLTNFDLQLLPLNGTFPNNRDKASLIYYRDNIYLFGGWSFYFSQVQPGASFTPHENYTLQRTEFCLGWNNEFFRYDMANDEWSYQPLKGSFPPPTAAATFTVVGDKAYFMCGRQPPCRSNDLYILNLITMEWTHIVPPTLLANNLVKQPIWPSPRSTHAVSPVYLNCRDTLPQLILYGGIAPSDFSCDDLWLLNINDLYWQRIEYLGKASIPGRSCFSMCAVHNSWSKCNEIVLFGGILGNFAIEPNKLGNTILMELGISSLKRLACISVSINIRKYLTASVKIPHCLLENLLLMHSSLDFPEIFKIYTRYNPFQPFPDNI